MLIEVNKINIKFSAWTISAVLIGVLLVASIFTGGNSITSITGSSTFQDIESKATNYVHSQMGNVEVRVLGVFEKNNAFEVSLKVNGENYVYILDGTREYLRKA